MKIDEINILNHSFNKLENQKNKNISYPQFDNFSRDYCSAIKSLNLSFCANIKEGDLKQKIDELKEEILAQGIDSEEIEDSLTQENFEKIQKVIEYFKKHPDYPMDFREDFYMDVVCDNQDLIDDENFYQGVKKVYEIYQVLLENPELYINGEAEDTLEAQEDIEGHVLAYLGMIAEAANIFDKDTMEFIFRKRMDNALDIFERFVDLEDLTKALLKEMINSKNPQGQDFSPNEKLTMLNILAGYESCCVDINGIDTTNGIDIEKLEKNLLREVFKFCAMSDEEIDLIPKEILSKWDIAKAHLLALQSRVFFNDNDYSLDYIIKAANQGKDFKKYIQGENYFGDTNFKTQEEFKRLGLNYENWVNPSKNCEVRFKYVDLNQERLTQVTSQIEEDIEVLRKTPARGFIDKHFADCISDDKFKINEKYSRNKQTLEAFAKNMFELLDRNIFARAKTNLNNPDKKNNAQITITIKNHLEQRLKDISQCDIKKKEKPIDLTIKMWDRNPIHDLFQGNYSTCCIGMGEANGASMPYYLLNTCFNMIELVDNETGDTIGNALCYLALNEFKEPQFIIDNIEIANKHKMSDSASDELLNQITGYAINLLRTISGRNIPIFLGTNFNDVNDEEITPIEMEYLKLIGEMNTEIIYLDVFDGWSEGVFDFSDGSDKEKLELLYLADSWQEDEAVADEDLEDWC